MDRVFGAEHEHSWVAPRLALGSGVWSRRDLAVIERSGITMVVDCRESEHGWLYAGSRLVLVRAPTDDDNRPKGAAWFAAGVFPALEHLRASRSNRVLVHCAMGINRSAAMVYAILRISGATPGQAVALIKRTRPVARPETYARDAERFVEAYAQGRIVPHVPPASNSR